MSARTLRYQLSCRNSVHPMITFHLVNAKILLQRWNQMTIARRQIRAIIQDVRMFCNYVITCHVNLFSVRPSKMMNYKKCGRGQRLLQDAVRGFKRRISLIPQQIRVPNRDFSPWLFLLAQHFVFISSACNIVCARRKSCAFMNEVR